MATPASAAVGIVFATTLVASVPAWAAAPSQPPRPAAVIGTVTDETGGVMQAATVKLFTEGAEEPIHTTVTDREGRFSLTVPTGMYRIEVSAPAFQAVQQTIRAGPDLEPLAVTLSLEVLEESVDVFDTEADFRVDPLSSLTTTMLSGDELLALPTDEEDLARYLLLLAGADSSGDLTEDVSGFIIDGFDDGRLPRPDEIAQIIIDPTPLRADGSGEGPRIEIVTRPGTGRWRRSVNFGFSDESLDATTPGERAKPARQTRDLDFDLRGPVIPGRLDIDIEGSTGARERAANSLRAITPAGDVFHGVTRPESERELEVDADLALGSNHSIGVRFDYEASRAENSGVGGFTLPERGIQDEDRQWSVQISDRMLGDRLVNDLRLRVRRDASREEPVSEGLAIDVADAFNRGGGTGRNRDDQTRIQVEDRLRWERSGWSLEAGFETWYERNFSVSEDNYNGTFDFASLHDYCGATGFVGVNCQATQAIVEEARALGIAPTYVNARGQVVEITGIPTTFTQTSGNGELDIAEVGIESFIQADRGFGEQASLRLGARYEATNHSVNFFRLSPTVNLQYRLFEDTIISAGSQLNFRDFRDYVRLIRNDGSIYQKQLFISSPSFPDPFLGGAVTIDPRRTSLYRLDPEYQAPFSVNPQVSVTQQLRGGLRLSVSYSMSYGFRQQRTRNINAPWPGTSLPDEILALPSAVRRETVDRMRPFYPIVGNINQMESTGRSVSRRFSVRLQRRQHVELMGIGFSGSVRYSHRSGEDDNDFNNPYLPQWGLARREHSVESQFRIRFPREAPATHPFLRALARATFVGTNLNFNVSANAGRPYSIRSGRDLNGDQSTRDRPPGVPRNSETGPARFGLDLTFTKEIRAGATDLSAPRGRGGGERLVRFQARVYNLLNLTQVRGYSGVLSSPLFGRPTGYLQGRTVRLSMHVDF